MKKLYILLIAVFTLSSCEDFEQLNVSPNLPGSATDSQLLANAMVSLPGLSSNTTGNFLAQYLAETQYVTASLYPNQASSFYGLYAGPLMNIQRVIDNNNTEGILVNQVAAAKVLKAYYMWHITDRWGDVPYTEALKGKDNFTPAYDSQESIYNNLFDLLEEANDQFVETGTLTNDIMYSGNISRWKKLGNSIRLLMALRLSEVNPTKAREEFNKALTAGVMTSNADNLVFRHLADANNQNYWHSQWVIENRDWWALTKTLVDALKPVDDPRLPVYGQRTKSTNEYVGLPYGTTQGMNTADFSLLGTAIYAQNAPVHLITYAQILFAQAEAAKRGWIGGGDAEAKRTYDLAIQSSVSQWTGSTAGAAALLTKPGVAYNSETALEQIGNQRYIHLFMNGYEAWAEWRRTGYPNFLVAPGGVAIPNRQIYPANETFLNPANYNAAVQRLGGTDGLYQKVWWDVN